MMLNNFLKNMKNESKGILAVILGLILILGTLGKLGVLQSILNLIMITIGLSLLFWGLNSSKSYSRLKDYFHKKK